MIPDIQVLIVEDDPAQLYFCQALLEKEGFSVACVETGAAAVAFLGHQRVHVVLLDLNLPDCDGLELSQTLCSDFHVPVLMMTVRDSPAQRFAGFTAGATDYLIKPFHPGELVFRLQRILQKTEFAQPEATKLVYGPWQLDVDELLLGYGDAPPIKLTAGQAEVMSLLLRAQGRTVSNASLQQAVAKGWGGNSKSVGVLISRLRRSLALMGDTGGIETVYGIGYRLTLPVQE
jgi:DNA-binding response OmpR family regulator